jgi:hypothetical protein
VPVIRDVHIHLVGDQPLVADLEALPGPDEHSFRCTNLRRPDGKRPTFVENISSTFIIPLSAVRLLELPGEKQVPLVELAEEEQEPFPPVENDEDEEPDADLLARIRDV